LHESTLAGPVWRFLTAQPEVCDPTQVVVERVDDDQLYCVVPATAEDCEAKLPFELEVRFTVYPESGVVRRVAP
jgi:hypothetical protein